MDGQRFDDIARGVATVAPSRRRVLRTLLPGGAGLLAVGGVRRVGPAAAVDRPRYCQRVYDNDPQAITSKNVCGVTPCGGSEACFCVQTVGHSPRCLTGFDPTAGTRDCPARDECSERAHCLNGRYCAKVEECCGQPRKICLSPCPRAA